ncbi:MAG TPA: hypothetical protein VFH68_02040 [Polyangia bacterium]|nr:hypothetical protein [Polyangia bacterium]
MSSWARGARAADRAAADCLAASAASLTLDNQHRLRAERAELLSCAAARCPPDIRNECLRRVDDINATIPSIIFVVKDADGNDVSAVKVTMDGEPMVDRLDGIAIAVDPGAHDFTFEMASRPPVRRTFVIGEGEKRRREIITLAPAANLARNARSAQVQGKSSQASPDRGPSESPAPSRLMPLVAAGIGVAGLGVGTFFGLQALSRRSDARKACPDLCTDTDGVQMWRDARRSGNLSTIGFVVGGVGLAGAVLLWVTARPEPELTARSQVTVGLGTIAVRGRW